MNDMKQALLSIIREAGKIMTVARDIGGATSEKGGDAANMVTVYDVAVQSFLMQEITALIPDAFFFAEEKENNAEDLMREHCFVIDPIDGTANFVHGYRRSAISVALFSRGEAVFAAVYDPYLNEMFSATKGGGAFCNDTPIHVSERDAKHALVTFGTSPYFKDTLGERSFRLAHAFYRDYSDIRRAGSAAIDLAYLAAGRSDVFFELILYPWDFAAGYLLVLEAGGKMTDLEGGPVSFAAPCSVLATTSVLYDKARETVVSEP